MKFTAVASPNIAIIKYWGKKDYQLNIPTNNSISFTMDDKLLTTTTVEFDFTLKHDELFLDGKWASPRETTRVVAFLDIVRRIARTKAKARVVSKNSFPKSAGLASSASGFAALAGAASKAAGLQLNERQLSILARLGSGSASRSIFGGAVEWQAGKKKDGSDSYAFQLSPESTWRHLRNVIALISEKEKKVSSIEGMKRLPCSDLFNCRVKTMNKRLAAVRKAIKANDFSAMAVPIMQDSNNMHATMLDSWPPVRYLTDTSFEIIEKVHELNAQEKEPIAAYTFDAGPNAHIYTTAKYAKDIAGMLRETEGVQNVITCGIGKGIRFGGKHLL
jgi:diphosphomevalonate decarboxylase